MKILVTFFEAFDGRRENSTGLTVKAYQKAHGQNSNLHFLELPVTFKSSWQKLENHLKQNKYDFIIALGEAANSQQVQIERVALNWMDARIPDNEGFQPKEQKIDPNKNEAYFSSLPVKDIVDCLNGNDIPCKESLTAGAYVCNFLMFQLLNWAEKNSVKAGFIHLPLCDTQVQKEEFSLPVEKLAQALHLVFHTMGFQA